MFVYFIERSGISSIRFKILIEFLNKKVFILAGLLTDDARRKERKQPGKRNARRKYKLYVQILS